MKNLVLLALVSLTFGAFAHAEESISVTPMINGGAASRFGQDALQLMIEDILTNSRDHAYDGVNFTTRGRTMATIAISLTKTAENGPSDSRATDANDTSGLYTLSVSAHYDAKNQKNNSTQEIQSLPIGEVTSKNLRKLLKKAIDAAIPLSIGNSALKQRELPQRGVNEHPTSREFDDECRGPNPSMRGKGFGDG